MNTQFFSMSKNKATFDLIEEKFNEIKQLLDKMKTDDDAPVFLSGIQDVCDVQLNKIARIKQKIIQASCKHEFIDDFVDISLDKSVMITYCKHCEYCAPN